MGIENETAEIIRFSHAELAWFRFALCVVQTRCEKEAAAAHVLRDSARVLLDRPQPLAEYSVVIPVSDLPLSIYAIQEGRCRTTQERKMRDELLRRFFDITGQRGPLDNSRR